MTFEPTPEQKAIIAEATGSNANLLISALAGAAKTSTIVLIAHALQGTSILCLAFNVRIAKEMQERLPAWCEARTLNSLGHRIWKDTLGKNLVVDADKVYRLLKEEVDKLTGEEKTWAFEMFTEAKKNIEYGKAHGWIPNGHFTQKKPKPLLSDEEFFAEFDEEPSDLMRHLVHIVTVRSLEEAFQGKIDYIDQILMPSVFPALYPRYPVVMVDEAQDLSELNHRMLERLVGQRRLIAVGDECQAIYGFRGARENSMRELQQKFGMKELILSVSFRCPISVVEEARWRAPHMQYPEWAKSGEVRHIGDWDVTLLTDDAVIICRNNSPLFSMAFKLIRSGRYPELVGNDLGKSLLKTLRAFSKKDDMSREDLMEAIARWRDAKMEKARNKSKIEDQAACLMVFAEQGKTLGEAIAYATKIMNMAGPVKLMTGHKSKGLEFENVYFLDEHLVRDDQQDKNLRYVIQTRAKSTLTYIRTEDFHLQEDNTHEEA